MAFGIKRDELREWKREAEEGRIAFITHFWKTEKFPGMTTVTKVGCCDRQKLIEWGKKYGLKPGWIDENEKYPHFDLIGSFQQDILKAENKLWQLERLKKPNKKNQNS
ncbi:hypothetical protein CEY16_02950 [Halalkalibacillus sediminis]|uniref:YneQ n=1 Tax=Halalkalibacillus sediminis TaxID=2018042 RepID=A0A2I0QWL4_9BACI|nr:hypothetical protein [Halalkalibacillus sediminis]PKR78731.1 hypothetical protein CEY16_02950 [Halalkalibacillus sediminis]